MFRKAIAFITYMLCLFTPVFEADGAETDSISYIPVFHGVFRGRWELETSDGNSRFQVRNARVSIEGRVAPIVSYLFRTDLCDCGKILILDAYATIDPVKSLKIQLGQYRMPFGIESFRGPGGYYFNNRSYIGKWVNNYRAVGLSSGYTFKGQPLTIEAGVFNPTVIADHAVWVKKYAYASRLVWRPSGWVMAAGFESIVPCDVRINLASATLGWGNDRFYAEAEYMARCYTRNTHSTTHAFNIFGSYGIPMPKGLFDTLSFQARFDGMTDLASGTAPAGADGLLATTFDGRKRLTVGSTLDYKYRKVRAAVRLNYEKVWFEHGGMAPQGQGDLLGAELIVKF